MSNNDCERERMEEQRRLRGVIWIYGSGALFWFAVWPFAGGYGLLAGNLLMWFPFLACPLILIANIFLWSAAPSYKEYEQEVAVIEFVERNAAHAVLAITGALIIAASISGVEGGTALSQDFLKFEAWALIWAVVGVLPLYWIPPKKTYWLVLLRHFKTVPFTYGVTLFLAGLLMLLSTL